MKENLSNQLVSLEDSKKLLGNEWGAILHPICNTEYFINLMNLLNEEYSYKTIYPKMKNVFRCFNETPFRSVKVVILGQDPYYTDGMANGLAFSVDMGVKKIPPSLLNIEKEVNRSIYDNDPIFNFDYSLSGWYRNGVLLLNTALTVEQNKPESHLKIWEPFITFVIQKLSEFNSGLVWMLWGSKAQKYEELINKNHYVLKSNHPSPLSATKGDTPFIGNDHFKEANNVLGLLYNEKIPW